MWIVEVARGEGPDTVLTDVARLPPGVVLSERRHEVGAIVHGDVPGLRRFEVTTSVQLEGEPGPVRMYVFFGGRPSMARDDVLAHWRDLHAPLARRHHVGMCRYVQHVVLAATDDGVDAIAELHFRSFDDLADRFYDSDEGRRVIAADIATFAGRAADTYITMEQP